MKKSDKNMFKRKSMPYVAFTVILITISGWLSSFLLLKNGMHTMWLRYAISVLIAFVVAYFLFLLLIKVIGSLSSGFEKLNEDINKTKKKGSWSFLDGVNFDLDGLCLIFVFFIVIAIFVIAIFAISSFTIVIAEIALFDVGVSASLLPVLRRKEKITYKVLFKALAIPFLILLLIAVIYGLIVQNWLPEIDSVGDIWHYIRSKK
jgi:hypothetical protein